MKTSKLFSTISYNSIPYLQTRLDELVQRSVLYLYAFVYHFKEEDEKRDHIHVLFWPNGTVDTDKIFKYLEEYDPTNPTLPLRCRPPHKTNVFGDWYLYNKHDPKYLEAHGQQRRKYEYPRESFVTNDDDEFDDMIRQIDYRKMYGNKAFFDALEKGVSLTSMVEQGIVPMQQYGSYSKFVYDWTENQLNRTFRGNKSTHTPLVDTTTGEVKQVSIDELQPTDDEGSPF